MADPVLASQAQDPHALSDSRQNGYHHAAPAHDTDVEFRIGNINHSNTDNHRRHHHNHHHNHIRSHIHNRRAHHHHKHDFAPLRLPHPPQLKRDAPIPTPAPVANPIIDDNTPIVNNDDNDGPPITIHHTVSIVQVIDNAGAVVQVHTLPPNAAAAATANPAPVAQATAGVNVAISAGASIDVAASVDLPPANVPTPTASATAGLGVGLSVGLGDGTSSGPHPTGISSSPLMSTFPSLSYSHVTATPLSHPPAFSSIPGANNSTQASSSVPNSSSSSYPFSSSSFQSSASTTVSSNVSETTGSDWSSYSTFASTTSSSDSTSTSSPSGYGYPTGSGSGYGSDGNHGDSGSSAGGDPSTSPAANNDGSSHSVAPPATIAGSVVGSVAGVAMIFILAMFLLRRKKGGFAFLKNLGGGGEKGAAGGLLTGAPSSSPGGAGAGAASGAAAGSGVGGAAATTAAAADGSRGGGGMSERPRSIPFSVPAALAGLSSAAAGKRRSSEPSEPGSSGDGQKGFQKISGRKLPSVLLAGGDGYSDPRDPRAPRDPRDTFMSDDSMMSYRDSMAIFGAGPGNKSTTRFAVGTPMRPDSGIPVFHDGPPRHTPVTEQGSFPPSAEGSRQSLQSQGRSPSQNTNRPTSQTRPDSPTLDPALSQHRAYNRDSLVPGSHSSYDNMSHRSSASRFMESI